MKFIPLFDKVLVKPASDTDRKTQGGLYIPNSNQVKITSGMVIAVGSDCLLVMRGDAVMLSPYKTSVEVDLEGEKFLVVPEKEILGIVKDNTDEN